MEALTLKQRLPVEESIENWDDDVDFPGLDDLHFRNVSTTTVGSNPHHRDSISSRMSTWSDHDSVGGGDEDWQVLLPEDDENSTADAINSAKTAGIPIPQNVPASALLGGTIKRLGGRRLKKAFADDWSEDIAVPTIQEGGLKLKRKDEGYFPDTLRGFSSEFPTSPTLNKPRAHLGFAAQLASATKARTGAAALEKFKDDESDDFIQDVPTIQVAKNRSPQKLTGILPDLSIPNRDPEDMALDLELPDDGKPLRLSTRKEEPRTPTANMTDDFDLDWAEGSLGTRFGGTRRDLRSNHSSSISAFSPSASSCLTAESEDDGLEGLVLPHTDFKFGEALKKRIETATKDGQEPKVDKARAEPVEKGKASIPDDFFSGLDIGDGDVFDSGKLTLNRNIKHKASKSTSPARRPATTLTFTNKVDPGVSRIPRYQFHERQRSTLESVSESGPAPQYRRSASRLGGPSPQTSSAIPTPSTPSHSNAPSTPSRRGLNTKNSQDMLRSPNTTHPSQYLKAKRSMPMMTRNQPLAARPPQYQRPPSRGQATYPRPKTPVDRSGAESSMSNARKTHAPFLPAGTPHAQSHHVSAKTTRHHHRPTSSDSSESAPVNRPLSRLSQAHRSNSPTRTRQAPDSLVKEATSKRPITRPTRRRAFGDGNELEVFDDLPTSASAESKFMKQPVGRGAPKSVQNRSKLGSHHNNSSSTSISEPASTQLPSTPLSPIKNESVPRFARDTNASRLAREQRIGSVSAALHSNASLPTVRETSGLSSLAVNRQLHAQSAQRHIQSPMVHTKRRPKGPPQKPRLIKPMGEVHNHPKEEKGMQWNPVLCRWDGNENVLAPFDVPSTSPGTTPKSPSNSASKAAPALISNVGATKGVQVSGGMVFDPQSMRWLKAAPSAREGRSESNPLSPTTNAEEDDDPFAGIDDLDDKPKSSSHMRAAPDGFNDAFGPPIEGNTGATLSLNTKEDLEPLFVGEEFDVGPEFIKRLRTEEERWRAKVAPWVGEGVKRDDDDGREWKWAIKTKLDILKEIK